MLVDVHAHFLHDRTPRSDWRERNASRLRAGERIGITIHVASILGSWGLTSPIYFPSPADLTYGNDQLLGLQREHPTRIRGYVAVNPNFDGPRPGRDSALSCGRYDRDQARGQSSSQRPPIGSDL